MVRSWGPQEVFLYQLELASTIEEGMEFKVVPMNNFFPRGTHGLTEGPAPTRQLTPYSSGYSGSALLVTSWNNTRELWEVDLQNTGARKVATLSEEILAIESTGTWDNVFAIVNRTEGAFLAKVDIVTGGLTVIGTPPLFRFTGLTRHGSNLIASVALNATHVVYYEISATGQILSTNNFYCPSESCGKIFIKNGFIGAVSASGIRLFNSSELPQSNLDAYPLATWPNRNCPPNSNGANGCTQWYYSYEPTAMYDYVSHPNADVFLWNFESTGPVVNMPYITAVNLTTKDVTPVSDLRVDAPGAYDAAFFVRDRAFCSNNGNYVNNYECVCDDPAVHHGVRCELTYAAPVAPPVAAPVSAPSSSGVALVASVFCCAVIVLISALM